MERCRIKKKEIKIRNLNNRIKMKKKGDYFTVMSYFKATECTGVGGAFPAGEPC